MKEAENRYRQKVRPQYLLSLARKQNRLDKKTMDLPGATPQDKLAMLPYENQPLCEVAVICDGKSVALDVHHKKGRGRFLTKAKFFAGVCRQCHDYIELNRTWAIAQGWIIERNKDD